MNKNLLFTFFVLIQLFVLNLFSSCDVGLGPKVDVERPKVQVSYPPVGSIIRSEFLMTGTFTDDIGCEKVDVKIINAQNPEAKDVTLKAEILSNGKKGTWQCKINTLDFSDSSYSIEVVAYDKSNGASDPSRVNYDFDNTAPVFIIEQPASNDVFTDFGSQFKVSGTIVDEHSIPEMTVDILDDSPALIKQLRAFDVEVNGGTNVTFAKVGSDETLDKNYKDIYDVSAGGTQQRYCTVYVSDNARIYSNPKEKVNNSEGNRTTEVYTYEKVYSDLMGAKSKYQIEASEIMKIINGTYSGKFDPEEILEVLNSAKIDTKNDYLQFTLNQNASPKYSFMGYSFEGDTSNISTKATKGGKVTFQVQAGLNGTLFNPKNAKVYLFGPFSAIDVSGQNFVSDLLNNVPKKFEEYAKFTDAEKEIIDVENTQGWILYDGLKDYKGSTTEIFTQAITLPEVITLGKIYILAATGFDSDGFEFECDGQFAFIGESAGEKPTALFTSPLNDQNIPEFDTIKISGNSTSTQNQIKEVFVTANVQDLANGVECGTIKGKAELKYTTEDKKKCDWEIDLTNPALLQEPVNGQKILPGENCYYRFDVSVKVTDSIGGDNIINRTFYIDSKDPVINFKSVLPVVESDGEELINGTVTYSANVSENNLKKVTLEVSDGTTATVVERTSSDITEQIKTYRYKDGTDLTFTLTAFDEAGNKLAFEKIYKILQKSNKPVLNGSSAIQDLSFDSITNGSNLFDNINNNKITGTISDDDGIKSVSVTAKKNDGTLIGPSELATYGLDSNPKNYQIKNPNAPFSLSYELPAKEGKYTIEISATDISVDEEDIDDAEKLNRKNVWSYNVAVDANYPELTFTTANKSKTGSNKAKEVEGVAKDSNGITSIKRFVLGDDGKITGPAETKWVSGEDGNSISYDSATGVWKDTLSAEVIGAKDGVRRYVVSDIYGKETSADFIFYVDATRPTYEVTNPVAKTEAFVNGTKQYTIVGKATDNESYAFAGMKYLILKTTETPLLKEDTVGGVPSNVYDLSKGNWKDANLSNSNSEIKIDGVTHFQYEFQCIISEEDFAALGEGTYNVYFAALDAASNQSLPDDNSYAVITIDLNNPEITVNGSISDSYNTIPTLTGTIQEAYLKEFKVRYKVGNETEAVVPLIPADNNWSWKLPKAGNYTKIVFEAEDKVGNVTTTSQYSTIVDNSEPVFVNTTASRPLDSYSRNSTQTLKVWVGDSGSNGKIYSSGIASVEYKLGNGSWTAMDQGGTTNADGTKNSAGFYRIFSSTIDMENGINSVSFRATDNASNTASFGPVVYKIDTVEPTLSSFALVDNNTNKVNSSLVNQNVVLNYTDGTGNVSGVLNLTIKKGGSSVVTKEVAKDSTTSTESIPREKFAEGMNVFTATVTDNAGNVSAEKQIQLDADFTAPLTEIISHAKGSVVNKKITLEGTASDANGIDTTSLPVLYISSDGKSWSEATSGTPKWVTTASPYKWEIKDFDTEGLTDKLTYYIAVVVKDTYGNVSVKQNDFTLAVNQNSDRPSIRFSNVKTSGSFISSTNKTIYGTIEDDDGLVKELWATTVESESLTAPSGSGSEKWFKISGNTSSFSHQFSGNEGEGDLNLYFYVKDKNGGEFFTKNSNALLRPIVTSEVDGLSIDTATPLGLKVDVVLPAVKLFVAHKNIASNYASGASIFGGNQNKLYLKAVVTENVAMETVNPISIGGYSGEFNQIGQVEFDAAAKTYTYVFGPIDVTKENGFDAEAGSTLLTVTAKDAAGQEGVGVISISVDNDAPYVKIISPTSSLSDAVVGATKIKGVSSDAGAGISEIYYTIPTVSQKSVLDTMTDSEVSNYAVGEEWTELSRGSTWEIEFASGDPNEKESILHYANSTYAESIGENIWKVPVYFFARDSVGNSIINKSQYVIADGDSGKPKAWIIYPETGSTTSDTLVIYGGASDNISVSEVQVQLDVNGDGAFDASDYALLKGNTSPVVPSLVEGNSSSWFISASGTNSWKLTVDTTQIGDQKTLGIRVRSYDNEGNTREWSSPVTVTINNSVPVIQNLKLVKYSDQNKTDKLVEREYISGMYINGGTWYLEGSVKATGKIDTITLSTQKSIAETFVPLDYNYTSAGNETDYNFSVLVNTAVAGSVYSTLTVMDKNSIPKSTTENIKFNIDIVAPAFYNISGSQTRAPGESLRVTSLGNNLADNSLETNQTVQNNNNCFTFGDNIVESGSGIKAVVFYFVRREKTGASTTNGDDVIYAPVFEDAKFILSKIAANGKVSIDGDGLAVYSCKAISRSSENEFALSTVDLPEHLLQVGGLVRIGGQYSVISSVSGGSVTFSPGIAVDYTNIDVIVGNVVDHNLSENWSDDFNSVVNDDGDGVVEYLYSVGQTYTWQASIKSQNIPDGPVELHVVAIDEAGNISNGYVNSFVSNNRPRIAKVLLGTDLNGDGKFAYNADSHPVTSLDEEKSTSDGKAFGEFNYYSAINKQNGKAQSLVTIKSGNFKIKDKLVVIPEFVGGNQNLMYNMQNVQISKPTAKSVKTLTALTSKSSLTSTYILNTGSKNIGDQITAFGGVQLENSNFTANGSKTLGFTFWDQTLETVQGVDSQWAILNIPVSIQINDEASPSTVVSPLYWNSKEDNSVVYQNGYPQGHVELGEDWKKSTGYSSIGVAALKDNDDKVSGKIKFTGTSSDEKRLTSISASFAGFTNTATVNYSNGAWGTPSYTNNDNEAFQFQILSNEISQEGHFVKWQLTVDTEKVAGVASTDKVLTVTAKDGAVSPHSGKGTYKVDIVPYITTIWTPFSEYNRAVPSLYARSATGRYPVREGEEITVYGWNFNNNPSLMLGSVEVSQSISKNTNENVKSGTYGLTVTSFPSSASNSMEVKVNSIPSINNYNFNDSCGTFTGDDTSNENHYNMQPNGLNNNNLNDDVAVDVWEFKNAAEPVGSGARYAHMKVSPTGTIGFSFKNAIGYFNMPGYMYEASGTGGVILLLDKGTITATDKDGKGSFTATNIHYWTDSQTYTEFPGKNITDLTSYTYNGKPYYAIEVPGISALKYLLTDGVKNSKQTKDKTEITSSGIWLYSSTSKSASRLADYPTSVIDTSTVMSQTRFGSNFGGFNHNNFCFDANGMSYGVAQCSDTSGKQGISANLQFFSRQTGSNSTSSSEDLNFNYLNVTNARRIESTSYVTDSGEVYTDEDRCQNPSMASYVNGSNTYIYMAYYDHAFNTIKFRVGAVYGEGRENANKIGLGLKDLAGRTNGAGGSKDDNKIGSPDHPVFDSTDSSYKGDSTYDDISAYHFVKNLNGSYGTSKYVSVASLNDGTAVVVWFDGNGKLLMSYNSFANVLTSDMPGWTTRVLSTNGGAHVSVAVDANNGLHFAYSSNMGSDLYYGYLSSVTGAMNEILVDAYDNVGTFCTIDVGRESLTGNWIPYISYKRDGSSTSTKVAYPVKFNPNGIPMDGAYNNGLFTGNWNVSTIPCQVDPSTDEVISVGLKKSWTTGVISPFTTGTDDFGYNPGGSYTICNSSVVYGNGTSNPVIGYAGQNGNVIMAQKK